LLSQPAPAKPEHPRNGFDQRRRRPPVAERL